MSDFLSYNNLDAPNEKILMEAVPRYNPIFANTGPHRLRVALYSHDTMGLGHIRRNLAIAEALVSCQLRPIILLLSGVREICAFNLPACVDSIVLPALYKNGDGSYRSRYLDVTLNELRLMRETIITAALETFVPDVLIVDKEPTGAIGELRKPLEALRLHGHTRCVLGLRDVLDEPLAVQKDWSLHNKHEVIRRYYDAVWVYGDASVYNLVQEYRLPHDVAAMTCYTGYLGRFQSDAIEKREENFLKSVGLKLERLVICTVGGGQDGERLAEAFMEIDLPPDTCGLLMTGPYMSSDTRQRLHTRISTRPSFRLIDFAPRPISLLQQADCIITMGGYNTICEALSLGKRLLVVPRVSPRREQLIRAERMQELGLLDMLHPDAVTPEALNGWLRKRANHCSPVGKGIDLNGMKRLPGLLAELLNAPSKLAIDNSTRRRERVG